MRKKISKLQNAMQEFGERFNQEELIRQAEAARALERAQEAALRQEQAAEG